MSYEVKYTTTLSLRNSTPRYSFKGIENMFTKRCVGEYYRGWDLLEVGKIEFSEVIQIFSITFIKTHQIVYFRYVSFTVHEFYFK